MKYAIVDFEELGGIHASLKSLKLLVALVPSEFTVPGPGDRLIAQTRPHFPLLGIMLVSIESNGFRAHAAFQTHTLLALLQIPLIEWATLDLDAPLPEDDLPF